DRWIRDREQISNPHLPLPSQRTSNSEVTDQRPDEIRGDRRMFPLHTPAEMISLDSHPRQGKFRHGYCHFSTIIFGQIHTPRSIHQKKERYLTDVP
ncbi:MAG TPA: hypothetical protein VMT62_14470, partial [Syntrophorhabdaceae bacterium]|nr:hypothetical protein [Syntrophorhabdaceae bacterium]